VTDNGNPPKTASIIICITVGVVNQPPVLNDIGDQTVEEGSLLEFTVGSTDEEGDSVDYSLTNLPAGVTFNTDTGVFSWTPELDQSGTYSDIIFSVTSSMTPAVTDSETISISVLNKWWNDSWIYRREISITENGAGDLADYQINIDLDLNSAFDFSHTKANGDDIRFTYYDPITKTEAEIGYWIEEWNSNFPDQTSIWIDVTEIPSGGTATVFMYYGNNDAVAASLWENVFDSNGFYANELTADENTKALWHFNSSSGNVELDSDGGENDFLFLADGYEWTAGKFGNGLGFANGFAYSGQETSDLDISPNISINEWTHIAFTHDGSNAKFYINGKLNCQKPLDAIQAENDEITTISKDSRWGAAGYMDGKLDELRICNVVLSNADIMRDAGARNFVASQPTTSIGDEE